jgi:hypothetical protein
MWVHVCVCVVVGVGGNVQYCIVLYRAVEDVGLSPGSTHLELQLLVQLLLPCKVLHNW